MEVAQLRQPPVLRRPVPAAVRHALRPGQEEERRPVGLIVGLVVVVFVVIFGGIAAVVWNVSSTIEESGIAGGGGSVDRPGGAPTYTPPSISFPSIPPSRAVQAANGTDRDAGRSDECRGH